MDRLWDALGVLLKSSVTLVQLIVEGVLLIVVWAPIAIVAGAFALVYRVVTGEEVENGKLLVEPLDHFTHQIMVLFGMHEEFYATPYLVDGSYWN